MARFFGCLGLVGGSMACKSPGLVFLFRCLYWHSIAEQWQMMVIVCLTIPGSSFQYSVSGMNVTDEQRVNVRIGVSPVLVSFVNVCSCLRSVVCPVKWDVRLVVAMKFDGKTS